MASAQTAGNLGQTGVNSKHFAGLPNGQHASAIAASGGGVQNPHQEAVAAQIGVAPQQERSLVPRPVTESSAVDQNTVTFGAQITRLPVELDVSIPLRDFRVRDLLALEPGRLIESEWSNGVDLPLAAGQVQLAWTEFEVIETDLVVRLTRLA